MLDKTEAVTVIYGYYEWNANKNKINIEKHNISFEAAIQIFKNIVIERPSKIKHGEERLVAIGALETKEIVVIYTNRNTRKRIISARRARENERKAYGEFLQKFYD